LLSDRCRGGVGQDAFTASGPSSFTGKYYLVPVVAEAESRRHVHVEAATEAVVVSRSDLGASKYASHRFVNFQVFGLVLKAIAEDFSHNLMTVHLRVLLSSQLRPGSAALEGLVSFQQEGEYSFIFFSLSTHADFVVELLVALVAGIYRAVNAVSVLRADLAHMLSRFNLKISTVVLTSLRNAHAGGAEVRSVES